VVRGSSYATVASAVDMEGSAMFSRDVDHDAVSTGTVRFDNVHLYGLGLYFLRTSHQLSGDCGDRGTAIYLAPGRDADMV
jgi:hypothetical protein